MIRFLLHLRHKCIRILREFITLRQVGKHMGEVHVGGPTRLTKNTTINRNPNFNGMTINGYGYVTFGDNFH